MKLSSTKRAHAVLQEAIINLVNVGEIVDRLAAGIFVVQANFVVEDGVEADVFEAGGLLYLAQVAAVIVAKRQHSAAGAEHLFPEVREGVSRSSEVDLYGFARRLGLGRNRECEYKNTCRDQNEFCVVTRTTEEACAQFPIVGSFPPSRASSSVYRR